MIFRLRLQKRPNCLPQDLKEVLVRPSRVQESGLQRHTVMISDHVSPLML